MADVFNQTETFERFDFKKKNSNSTSTLKNGRPIRSTIVKWTQPHFALKISMDLVDSGKRVVAHSPTRVGLLLLKLKTQAVATSETESTTLVQPKAPAMGASREDRLDMEIRTSSWEIGEGSGTHREEAKRRRTWAPTMARLTPPVQFCVPITIMLEFRRLIHLVQSRVPMLLMWCCRRTLMMVWVTLPMLLYESVTLPILSRRSFHQGKVLL